MKNFKFNFKSIVQSKARWLLTLIAILTIGVGQMWAASYLKGSWDSWAEGPEFSNGFAFLNVTTADTYRFKVLDEGNWTGAGNDDQYTVTRASNSVTLDSKGSGGNIKFTADVTGTYLFVWNDRSLQVIYPATFTEDAVVFFTFENDNDADHWWNNSGCYHYATFTGTGSTSDATVHLYNVDDTDNSASAQTNAVYFATLPAGSYSYVTLYRGKEAATLSTSDDSKWYNKASNVFIVNQAHNKYGTIYNGNFGNWQGWSDHTQPTSTGSLSASKTNPAVGVGVTLTPSLTSNTEFNKIKSVAYTVNTGTSGTHWTIDGNTFTPLVAGSYTVTATITYNLKGWTSTTKTVTPTVTITGRNIKSLTTEAGTGISAVSGSTDDISAGQNIAISATVKDGYTWSTWAKTAGDGTLSTFTAGTKNQTVTVGTLGNITLTASATENMTTVNLIASPTGAGTFTSNASTVTSVSAGVDTKPSVTAIPGNGYYLNTSSTIWTKNNSNISLSATDAASTTITGCGTVSTSSNLTATFTKKWYVKGDWSSWNESYPLVFTSATSAYVDIPLTGTSALKFKIWDKENDTYYTDASYHINRDYHTTTPTTTGGTSNDMDITPDINGSYRFAVTFSTGTPSALDVTYPTVYTVNFGVSPVAAADAPTNDASISSGSSVISGTSITFTKDATPNGGYTWKGWYDNEEGDGDALGTGNTYTTTISGTTNVYACYTEDKYTVTFNNGDHGTVSPSGDQQVGVSGVEITATPAGGYKFDHWSKTGNDVTLSSTTDNPTTVTAAGTGSVTANYAERYILLGSIDDKDDTEGGMAGWTATSNSSYTSWSFVGNVLTIRANLTSGDTKYKFQIVDKESGAWHGQTGESTITASSKWTLDGGNDVFLQTTEAGEYIFVFDFSGGSNPDVSVAYPGTYLSGSFTNWGVEQDNIRFNDDGEASVELEEGNYEFKIIYGGAWYGKNDFTVTTTVLDQTLSTSGANCNITVPEGGGTYLFTWDALNTKLSVFTSADAAKAKLTKNTYIYCDARGNGNWKSASFDARFWFKNYGSGTDIVPAVTCNKTNALQDWVFYAQVPNSDLVGRVQMNRLNPLNHSDIWTTSSVIQAYTRSDANQNCMVVNTSDDGLTWGTYCPPMKTVTLSDNSTVTYGGNGNKATPYLVEKGGTIKLQAHTTKYVNDDNMTPKFLFFDAATQKVDQTDSAYNYTADASAGTVHKMVVKTYNTYNSVKGDTIEITDTLFYQTVTCYNVTYSAPTNGDYTISVAGGSASSATKKAIAGQTITLAATPVNQAYTFKAWTVTKASSGTVTVTDNTFTMPSEAVTVTAEFEPRFALMGSRNTEGGETEGMPGWTPKNILPDFTVNSVGTPDGSGNVTTNLTCVRTLLPNRCYKFEVYDRKDKVLRSTSASEDQVTLAADASLQLTSTWDDVNYPSTNTNKDVLIYTVGYGTYTFKITAISADGYPTITVERQASYLLNMGCTDNGSVSAETTEGGQHFAITDGQYVASGGTITFTASPNVGYALNGWYSSDAYSGEPFMTANPSSINDITATVNVYAKFVPDTLTFVGGHEGNEWNEISNWSPACIPTIEHVVVLQANATLYGRFGGVSGHGRAKSIKIDKSVEGRKNIRLSIWTCSSLIVAEDIKAKHIGDDEYGAVNAEDLYIETTVLGNGVLICGSANANTAATYDFHSKAYKADNKWYINQYVGIPFAELDADKMRGFNIFVYDDAEDDWRTPGSNTMNPWTAYDLLCIYPGGVGNQELKGTLLFPGTGAGKTKALSPTRRDPKDKKWDKDTHPFPVSIDSTADHQDHMFANSWTAPIDIAAMEASDFTHLVHTIYIFNAGYEGDGVRKLGDEAGQWSSFPLEAVKAGEIDNAVIPATQAFLVTDTTSGASLTLDYKKHVYDPAKASSDENDTINNFPTRAPRRIKKDASLNSLKMFVRSEEDVIADRLYIIEGNNLRTDTFDNGWDGNKIMGESFAPQLYAMSDGSKMAVNAVKDMEGVKIGFKAGTSAQDYTLSFDYDEQAEPLYLYDNETNAYTEITNDATYEFTTSDRKAHERFLLTRSNSPKIPTGVEEIDTENVQRAQKFMHNQQIFIRRGDKIYSVDGRLVK